MVRPFQVTHSLDANSRISMSMRFYCCNHFAIEVGNLIADIVLPSSFK